MSLYIVLEREIDGFDTYVNGQALADVAEKDEDICNAEGVNPLMSYFSASEAEMAEFLDGEETEPVEISSDDEDWFSADDGLRTLAVLQKHFGHNKAVAAEIQEWKNLLALANQENIRWHVAVDV